MYIEAICIFCRVLQFVKFSIGCVKEVGLKTVYCLAKFRTYFGNFFATGQIIIMSKYCTKI